jgi:3-methyl-2-oxobutanoate hydroxymethyltransferase
MSTLLAPLAPAAGRALSASELSGLKGVRRLAVLTAYDYPTAVALDRAGLDMILVGDSLAQVELGLRSTREVSLAVMAHHTAAVARGAVATHLVGDLPADTYRTPDEAVRSARALVEAGAHSVKLEGALIPQVRAILDDGIPVMGHVGLLPQTAERMARQGRTPQDAERIAADARALDEAGCFSVVVEAVVPEVTARVTETVSCPTIGIASGGGCDGQVLVSADLLGLLPDQPPFVTPLADLHGDMVRAARAFAAEARGV